MSCEVARTWPIGKGLNMIRKNIVRLSDVIGEQLASYDYGSRIDRADIDCQLV